MPEIPKFVMEGAVDLIRAAGETLKDEVGARLFADSQPALTGARASLTKTPDVEKWLTAVNTQSAEWDKAAEGYPPMVAGPDPFKEQLERSLLQSFSPPGEKLDVLEIGPDIASTVPKAFQDRIGTYTAVELSNSALKGFRQGMEEQGVDTSVNHHFIHANGIDLQPIESQSKDVLYVSGATTAQFPWKAEAMRPDPLWTPDVANHALSEAARVLRPGGRMLIRPWGTSMQNDMDMTVFERHFPKVEVQRLPAPEVALLAKYAKDPDTFAAASPSYKTLVLTK